MIESFIKAAKVLDMWGNKNQSKIKIPTENSNSQQFPWLGAGKNFEQVYILKMN